MSGLFKNKKNAADSFVKKQFTYNRRQLYLAAASSLFFMAIMFSVLYAKKAEESLSSHIAPKVLRFHVLANSDHIIDQELKLEVKQILINTIYDGIANQEPDSSETEMPVLSKEFLMKYIKEHKKELEEKAETYMSQKGFSYSANIQIEQCYFPTKIYGDVVFPCGTYDAVRVLLGKGEGKNWWCVLYPPLCFTDNAYGEVPDSSKKELQNLLSEDDYSALMKNRRIVFGTKSPGPQDSSGTATAGGMRQKTTVRVRFRFLELLNPSSSK